MGCSNSSVSVKIENKSLSQLTNSFTIDKYEPNLEEDFGVLSFLELDKNRFLVLTQYNKILIYDKKKYEVISSIKLETTANSIIKIKKDKYIFGGDNGKLSLLEIDKKNNYSILTSFTCEKSISKIIEKEGEVIIASFNKIIFLNLNDKNELILKNSIEDNLLENNIYNIYTVDNLLLSLSYNEEKIEKNQLIIYDLNDNNKIVHKEEEASVIPWCNTICNFNSHLLIISGNDCEIRIFDIKAFKTLAKIIDLDFFYSVFCQGSKIFCGGNTGKLYEFEFNPEDNKLKLINQKKIHDSTIFSITKISRAIVTTSRDGKIKFFT